MPRKNDTPSLWEEGPAESPAPPRRDPKRLPEPTPAEVDELLARWDKTDHDLRRRIVARVFQQRSHLADALIKIESLSSGVATVTAAEHVKGVASDALDAVGEER